MLTGTSKEMGQDNSDKPGVEISQQPSNTAWRWVGLLIGEEVPSAKCILLACVVPACGSSKELAEDHGISDPKGWLLPT